MARVGWHIVQVLTIAIILAAVCSDFLAVHPPDAQNLEQFYSPPSRIRFVDAEGSFHLRPFVHPLVLVDPLDGIYEEKTGERHPLEFFVRGHPYRFLGLIPSRLHLVGISGQPLFPLGTDALGRCVYSRVLTGTRTSLLIVVLGVALYAFLGLAVGAAAGVLGGWIDAVLMRLAEFVLALPALYLILALRALLPLRISYWETIGLTVGTIAAVAWPPLARGVRGLILQLRSAGYVEAARALGCSRWWIFSRHMMPSLLPFVVMQSTVAAPAFLLGEVVLSFLDVGFRDAGESWGSMLRSLKDVRVLTDFWWNLAPLALVFLTLLCMNVIGRRLPQKDSARIAF